MEQKKLYKKIGPVILHAVILSLFVWSDAIASNIDVHAAHVTFYQGPEHAEKASVKIKNAGNKNVPLQLKAYAWTQNEQGENVYEETEDLSLDPRTLLMKRGEERLIAIRTDVGPGDAEKTYRICAEELRAPGQPVTGANAGAYKRSCFPFFISPVKRDTKADIETASINKGRVEVRVENKGNSHFIVTGVNMRGQDRQGKESFSREIGGWYIFAGSSKLYQTSIPFSVCKGITNLTVEVKTNKGITLSERLPIDAASCGRTDPAFAYGYEKKGVEEDPETSVMKADNRLSEILQPRHSSSPHGTVGSCSLTVPPHCLE